MKKLIIGGAAIADWGYLGGCGVSASILIKRTRPNFLMEIAIRANKKKWQKRCLITAANIATVKTHLFHFIQNSRLWVTKCNRIFRMGLEPSA